MPSIQDRLKKLLSRKPKPKPHETSSKHLPEEVEDPNAPGRPVQQYYDFVVVAGSRLGPDGETQGAFALADGRSGDIERHPLPQFPNEEGAVFIPNGTAGVVKSIGARSTIVEFTNVGWYHMRPQDLVQYRPPEERALPGREASARVRVSNRRTAKMTIVEASRRVAVGSADGQAFAQYFTRAQKVVAEIDAQKERLQRGDAPNYVPPQYYGELVESMYGVFNNGRAWADEVIKTRAIPPKQHKAIEMATRVLSVRSVPKDKLGWFKKNEHRLALLVEAMSWPERRTDEVLTGDLPNEDVFKIGGFEVHNTVGATGATLENARDIVSRAVQALASLSLPPLVYGKLYLVGQIAHKNWAAWYKAQADEMFLRPQPRGGAVEESARHLVHELGHRYWAKMMAPEQKQRWVAHHTKLTYGRDSNTPLVERWPEGAVLRGLTVNRKKDPMILQYVPAGVMIGDVNGEPIGKAGIEQFVRWTRELEDKARFPSPYAATNAEEHFSEALSFAAFGKLAPEPLKELEAVLAMGRTAATIVPSKQASTRVRTGAHRETQKLIRLLQSKLDPSLLKKEYQKLHEEGKCDPTTGHCYVASEALARLLGPKYRPQFIKHEGMPHWFLLGPDGEIVDATASQFKTPVPYEQAKGKGFLTKKPSTRAQELLRRMRVKADSVRVAVAPSHVVVEMIDDYTLAQYVEMELESIECSDVPPVEVTPELRMAANEFARMFNGVLNYWLQDQPDLQDGRLFGSMDSAAHFAFMDMQGQGTGLWDNWSDLIPKAQLDQFRSLMKSHPGLRNAFQRFEEALYNAAIDACPGDDEDPGDDEEGGGGQRLVRTIRRQVSPSEEAPRVQVGPMQASIRIRVAEDMPAVQSLSWHGFSISIEARGGETRAAGSKFPQPIPQNWVGTGFFNGIPAEDGDSLDVIIGPEQDHETAYLVSQKDINTGEFIQFKVMLGFDSEAAAEAGFKVLWPAQMFADVVSFSADDFIKGVLDKLVAGPEQEKTAAGVVDLKGIDDTITDVIMNAMTEVLKYTSLTMSHVPGIAADVEMELDKALNAHSLGELVGESTILRDWRANKLFHNLVTISVRSGARANLGGFHPQTKIINIYLQPLLRGLIRAQFKSDDDIKWDAKVDLSPQTIREAVHTTLAHELRHAADWAYQNTTRAQEYEKESLPESRPGMSWQDEWQQYINTPTELKSHAGDVAALVWGQVGAGWRDFQGDDLVQLIHDVRPEILSVVQPENRNDFLRRVVKALEQLEARYGKVKFGSIRVRANGRVIQAQDAIPGGLGDDAPDDKFDPKELEMGIEDEMSEHARGNPAVGKEIAKDHLAKDPKYYSHMQEKEA